MTRINVVDVEMLCDEHLIAEHRELTRIPNQIASGKYNIHDKSKIPAQYTVRTEDNPEGGKGHCYFFVDKLAYLKKRYHLLIEELKARGFKHEDRWPTEITSDRPKYNHLFKDYSPDNKAESLNLTRIIERTPRHPHYFSELSYDVYKGVSRAWKIKI